MTTIYADCDRPLILVADPAELLADWTVNVGGYELTVPSGFQTDGASIPRLLWRLCGHPLEVPRVYAATVHDWLYSTGVDRGFTRADADSIYYLLLRHFGISAWRAGIEYAALRMFGASHYNNERSTT